MATISSTINLVDNISSKLESIKEKVEALTDSFTDLDGNTKTNQESLGGFDWDTFIRNCESAGDAISGFGKKMTVAITTPMVLMGKKMYTSAKEHESAFVGMTKTVDGTAEQYERLNELAKELSETTPMGYTDLMGVAQTGGNLGVAIDDMEAFLKGYSALQYATDQHISGESGAQLVADFLNITEGGVANIEKFGSTIVDLGNNFNATEDQILNMGKRMAAAGHLAGLSTPEILGMATAFRSVGINEEAGGSAASKLIKQLQLAAEVGGQAQEKMSSIGFEFDSGLDMSNWIDGMKTADLSDYALELGMTTEALKKMADSWLLLDQFAEVSGKTSQQFIEDWSKAPAQAMQDFFYGLNACEDGAESILATLNKMGITEIRESNLVAAMAARPELFASAISAAVEAYGANTAMMEEFNKQMGTQESQDAMLGNKLENTMANFGDNLINAIQPALDKFNELLGKFNSLSEEDQSKVLTAFAIFAATGPICTALGETISTIGKVSSGVRTIIRNAPTWATKIGAFFTNPATWGVAAGAAILLLIDYLDRLPSKMELLTEAGANIPITLDEEAYDETIRQIQAVQDALNGLKPGQVDEGYENTSIAVAYGFGTNEMYGTALAYEAQKANAQINQIASDYAVLMRQAEQEIADACGKGDQAAAAAAQAEYNRLNSELNDALNAARLTYTEKISELFSGMAKQYPEQAKVLEQAAKQYDLFVAFDSLGDMSFYDSLPDNWGQMTAEEQVALESAYDQKVEEMEKYILSLASELGYLDEPFEEAWAKVQSGTPWDTLVYGMIEQITADMNESLQTISDNPILASWLAAIVDDTFIAENLDLTNAQGALDGIVKSLDFQTAEKDALENGKSIGENLTLGMKTSIEKGTGAVSAAMRAMVQAALAAGNAAARIHSPSRETAWSAEMMVAGYVNGLREGTPEVQRAVAHLMDSTMEEWEGISDADAKKIRDLAERETINRFTTAEVKVEFVANNNINSELDLDGVVEYLENRVAERLEAVAEGVYA